MRWLVVLVLVSSSAAAQLSAVGTPVQVTPPTGVAPVRWPDVAYDATDDVFLAISGATNIMGQYFTRAGQPSGAAFLVNADTALYAQAPRVGAGPARSFLVTWHASTSPGPRVRARLVQHGGVPLTGDFDVSGPGSNHEMGAAIAWSPVSQVFLVAWQAVPGTLHAQRVSASGALVGGVINLDAAVGYTRDPGVGYDPASDRFLVAYAGCVANNDCFVRAQRVQASTGALVGTPLTLDAPITAGYIPEVALDPSRGRWLVVWYRNANGAAVLHARTVAPDGTLGTAQVASASNAAYDANSVAWNPVSGTFTAVTHSQSAQDFAVELDAEGAPVNATGVLFGPTGTTGNFNPRLTSATPSADWLAVTSTEFGRLTAQVLTTSTRQAIDAGSVVDAGNSMDAGSAADAGSTAPDAGVDAGAGGGSGGSGGGVGGGAGGGGGGSAVGGCTCSGAGGSGLWLLALLCSLSARRRASTPRQRPRL